MSDPSVAPDQRVRVLQAVGAIAMGCAALASALVGDRYPWVNGVTVVVSWVVGKLLGTPITPVLRSAFASMPPAAKAELSVQAVASMPPAARQEAINQIVFLASDRPPPPVEPDEPPQT